MSKILKSSAADKTALTSGTDKKTVSGYGINIDILKLDSLKNKKNSFGMGDAQTSKHGFNLTGVKTQMTAPDDEVNKCVGHDIKKISAANEHSVKTVLSSPTLDMNKYTSLSHNKFNYKLLVVGVVICLLFCVILLAGIVYTSAIFSKAITESAISGAADAVKMINENSPKPVESLDLEAVQVAPTSDDKGNAAYMGAIRNRYDEFASLTKAMPDEIEAFDSMIKYAVEKSKNKVLDSVFSGTDTANLMYAANGYNVWAYISDVKKKSGINFDAGTALLEAAALVRYSNENGIPLSLAVGVAQTESAFNPGAYSNKAACGPMQVVYDIHKALLNSINIKTKEELFTPDRGVQAGCYLLGRYLKAEGSVTGGLKRYYGALSPNYINKVLSNRHAFELYVTGIEKDVASAVKKEEVNWEKMAQPKVPVYKDTSSSTKRPATNKLGQSKNRTSNQGLTVRPNNTQKDTQAYYKNTGTIVISRPDGTTQKFNFKE